MDNYAFVFFHLYILKAFSCFWLIEKVNARENLRPCCIKNFKEKSALRTSIQKWSDPEQLSNRADPDCSIFFSSNLVYHRPALPMKEEAT